MEYLEQCQAFWEACDELRNSKIIIADSKVSKVLKSVVSCPALVEIVGEALVGYNLTNELNKLTGTGLNGKPKLELPNEPYRVIALVFSLLSEFDARRLDFQEFIAQYFPQESLTDSFNDFNEKLLLPFRDYLCEWVGFKEKKDEPAQIVEEVEECDCPECTAGELNSIEQFFEDVNMILNQIQETIKLDSKIKQDRLDDLNITINALYDVTAMQNFKIFNALLISLNTLLAPIKSVRFYNMELQNRIAAFYEI